MRLPRQPHHHTAPSSPGRSVISHCVRTTDDEDDAAMGHVSDDEVLFPFFYYAAPVF